jgi:hypothetical protein
MPSPAFGEKSGPGRLRFGALRSTLARRPLLRLLTHSGIVLVTITLILVFSRPAVFRKVEPDLTPSAPGMKVYTPPSSGPAIPPGIPPPLTEAEKKAKSRSYYDKMTK